MKWNRKFGCDCEEPVVRNPINMELEPRIIISSFEEQAVTDYIYRLEKISQAFGPEQPILVEIDSFGGSAYGLLRLIEAFNAIENKIVTYCNSKAMSAGLVLFTVIATKDCRSATPNARFMLHELQESFKIPGDIKDSDTNHKESLFLNKKIMDLFATSIGLSGREEVIKLIRSKVEGNELYLSAQEAKELAIVDHIEYLRLNPVTEFVFQSRTMTRKELETIAIAQEEEQQKIQERMSAKIEIKKSKKGKKK